MRSTAKENLNLGYCRKKGVAYYICRQLLTRREVVWGCDFRPFFSWSCKATHEPGPADLRSLKSAITVNRNEETVGECLPQGKAAVNRYAPIEGLWEKPMPLGKPGGYADAHNVESEIRK